MVGLYERNAGANDALQAIKISEGVQKILNENKGAIAELCQDAKTAKKGDVAQFLMKKGINKIKYNNDTLELLQDDEYADISLSEIFQVPKDQKMDLAAKKVFLSIFKDPGTADTTYMKRDVELKNIK